MNTGTYDQFSLMNAGWPAGCLLLAYAAWQPVRRSAARSEDWSGVAVSIGCAAIAVGVLLYDHFVRVSVFTLVLATATVFGVLLRLALTFLDHRRLSARSMHAAHTDSITGLGNRRALLRRIGELLEADGQPRFVVVLLDLNGFKEYNDSFGHLAGDALLARLGVRLAEALPEGGQAFRMGGDEFCAIVEETSTFGAARLAAVAGAALSDRGEGFEIDSAWGHIIAPVEANTPTEILKLADRRMYAAKAVRSSVSRQTARLLVRALAEREASLADHISDVADLAEQIGARLGLALEQCEQVRRAAELHDVGKMAIPDAILLKTGPLDDDEWVFVRRHTLTGEWILSAAPGARERRPAGAVVARALGRHRLPRRACRRADPARVAHRHRRRRLRRDGQRPAVPRRAHARGGARRAAGERRARSSTRRSSTSRSSSSPRASASCAPPPPPPSAAGAPERRTPRDCP